MVGVLEINEVEVIIEEALYSPKMKNYGEMIDHLKDFHYIFHKGKSYGIIGQCGEGGWGLSYNLAGRESFITGEIRINGKEATLKDFQNIGWYVGEGWPVWNRLKRNKSIYGQLKEAVKCNPNGPSIDEIIATFHLSENRLDKKVEELSWEKWRASIAIGYAFGKRIFCFPWLSTGWVNDLILNSGIHICIETLKSVGAVTILPTQKADSVDYFIDEVIYLNNSRHVPSIRAKQVVEMYMQNRIE